jgi:hypothetical protein
MAENIEELETRVTNLEYDLQRLLTRVNEQEHIINRLREVLK